MKDPWAFWSTSTHGAKQVVRFLHLIFSAVITICTSLHMGKTSLGWNHLPKFIQVQPEEPGWDPSNVVPKLTLLAPLYPTWLIPGCLGTVATSVQSSTPQWTVAGEPSPQFSHESSRLLKDTSLLYLWGSPVLLHPFKLPWLIVCSSLDLAPTTSQHPVTLPWPHEQSPVLSLNVLVTTISLLLGPAPDQSTSLADVNQPSCLHAPFFLLLLPLPYC